MAEYGRYPLGSYKYGPSAMNNAGDRPEAPASLLFDVCSVFADILDDDLYEAAQAGIAGSLAVTIDAPGIAADGTVAAPAILGEMAQSIADIAVAATGAVDVAGSFGATVPDVVVVATGAVDVAGTLDVAIAGISMTAAGTVDVAGTLDSTIGAVDLAATAGVEVQGTADTTIGDISLDAQSTVEVSGSMDSTIGDVALAATGEGTSGSTGTLNVAIEPIVVTAKARPRRWRRKWG